MTLPRGPQEVRNGRRVLRFDAVVLAEATSKRPGAPRWTELTVYGMDGGTFMVAKVGRSLVAHAPECPSVSPRMPTWLDAAGFAESDGEARVHRVPCIECQPAVGDGMDPQTRLEPTRYSVLQANTPAELVTVLTRDRPAGSASQVPPLVVEVLRQVQENAPGTFPTS